jgi:hypothetical protein
MFRVKELRRCVSNGNLDGNTCGSVDGLDVGKLLPLNEQKSGRLMPLVDFSFPQCSLTLLLLSFNKTHISLSFIGASDW